MNAADAIKYSHALSNMVTRSYLGDLTDAELLERPGDGCNHIAWQLGHLISSQVGLMAAAGIENVPSLPAGFAEKYTPETASNGDPADFASKDEYLALFDQIDAAFLSAVDVASEEDFDQPSPEKYQAFAPTIGGLYLLIASHPLMHAGQWVPVRRRLGKPVAI